MYAIMLLAFAAILAGCAGPSKSPETPPSAVPHGPLSQQERCAILSAGAADKWATSETRMIAYHAGVKFGCW